MWPVLFHLGPLTVYSYGTMMAVAFLVAGYLTSVELERRDLPGHHASDLIFWAAVGGLAGSRLWSIAEDWRAFVDQPWRAIFSGSGFVWYGGLVGGFLTVSLAARRARLPWPALVDSIAPGLALAHAVGRIGCQLAGDGDWGKVSSLPWAMAYPNAIVGWDYPPGVRVHPTPLYETIAYTAVFAVLWSIRKRPLPAGALFWLYLVLASGARFVIEFWRINPPALAGLSQAQLFSLFLVAVGGGGLIASRAAAGRPVPHPTT